MKRENSGRHPTVRLGTVWDDTTGFVRREAQLCLPVAFATLFPGQLANEIAPFSGMPALMIIVALAGLFVRFSGQLALSALAQQPGLRVGDAMRLGFRRAPVLLGVGIVALLISALLLAPVSSLLLEAMKAATSGGAGLGRPPAIAIPAWQSLYLLAFLVLGTWILCRLSLVVACIADGMGIVGALRASFTLTAGVQWRLLGFLAGFLVLTGLLVLTVQLIVQRLALVTGSSPRLLMPIASAAAMAPLLMILTLFLARLKCHLAKAGAGRIGSK